MNRSDTQLAAALADLQEGEALAIVQAQLAAGADPVQILETCRTAVETVGQRFENGEYFLPDLIMAGEILRQIGDLVKPHITTVTSTTPRRGTVLIGTVQGDIHDIGKKVVTFMLDAHGFQVHDLGVDVPPATFVDQIRATTPDIVAGRKSTIPANWMLTRISNIFLPRPRNATAYSKRRNSPYVKTQKIVKRSAA